jgi:hypothetical protein
MRTAESTVRYGAYDGRLRMEQAEALASEHADSREIHSWVDDKHFVLTVGERKLVIDLLRGKYDIAVGDDVLGKYTTWDAAAEKFEAVLSERAAAETEAG